MLGYVLISLKEGDENDVRSELLSLDEVKESHILFGERDLIAKIEVENPDALATFVMDKIRTMQQVKVSSTMIVAK